MFNVLKKTPYNTENGYNFVFPIWRCFTERVLENRSVNPTITRLVNLHRIDILSKTLFTKDYIQRLYEYMGLWWFSCLLYISRRQFGLKKYVLVVFFSFFPSQLVRLSFIIKVYCKLFSFVCWRSVMHKYQERL